MKNEINPLYVEQREIKGAETHGKYLYQYNWALYRAFQKHEKSDEYAIFVEFHEDVIISDSLNRSNAKFEFNQIKDVQKKYNGKNITKIDKGKKNSILGKLLGSSLNKRIDDKIDKIQLVSTGGFDIKLKNKNLRLDEITLYDIDISSLELFSQQMDKELNLNCFPLNLYFLVPDMPSNGFQNFLIGYIAKIVKNLFPHSFTSAEDIYLPLIDELNRKGIITYDFKQWDRLLEQKALTSITVTKIINEFTNRKQDEKVYQELEGYLRDLSLNALLQKKWKKSFDKYYLKRIGNKSNLQLDTSNQIIFAINENIEQDDIHTLIELVIKKLDDAIKEQFIEDQSLETAILCELILME
jgi:hypothetical protein